MRHRGFRYVGTVEAELPDTRQIASAVSAPARDAQLNPPTSIAVLPFEMAGDGGERAYVGEGIAADIIALLARHQWLTVIARGSSFAVDARAHAAPDRHRCCRWATCSPAASAGSEAEGRIDAELTDCDSARLLWNQSYRVGSANVQAVLRGNRAADRRHHRAQAGADRAAEDRAQAPGGFPGLGLLPPGVLASLSLHAPTDLLRRAAWFRKALAA